MRRLLSFINERWCTPSGYSEVLRLAIPLVMSTGSNTVQQFINRIFLSKFSADALAAALPAGLLSFAFMAFFLGTASYVSTFVAQYKGAGESQKAAKAVWQSIYFSIFASFLMLAFVPLAEPIFRLANHGKAIEGLEIIYFKILTAGAGFSILSNAVSGFFTGLGKAKTIMMVNLISAGINIILDYILIFGKLGFPRLGIVGGGYALVISSFISCIIYFMLFFKKVYRIEYGTLSAWKMDFKLLQRILKFGSIQKHLN